MDKGRKRGLIGLMVDNTPLRCAVAVRAAIGIHATKAEFTAPACFACGRVGQVSLYSKVSRQKVNSGFGHAGFGCFEAATICVRFEEVAGD